MVMWRLSGFNSVSDLNGGALYLASDASSFVTGIDLAINGGYQVW